MSKKRLSFPNILSFLRIILAALLYLFYLRSFSIDSCFSPLFIFIFYLFIALTDLLDGFLARRLHQETELGKELDPMADKVLVFLMLFAFFRVKILPLWMIIPVFLRDIFVNYLRRRSHELNIHFKTSKLAKAKTAVQMLFIGLLLFIPVLLSSNIPEGLYNALQDYINGPGLRISMFLVMLFTVYTGLDYYLKFRKSLHGKD